MKSVTFEEAMTVLKNGKTVYGQYENETVEITLKSEFSELGYNLSFEELLEMKWFIK